MVKEKLCRSPSPSFDMNQKITSMIVIFVWQILFAKKNKSKITYPNCESARKPVPHDETNPPPVPPADMTDTSSSEEFTSDAETGEDEMYDSDADNSPHLLG